MNNRSRSCGAPTSDARKSPPSTSKPSRRRSRHTRSAPPDESMPPTFSRRRNHAPVWTRMRLAWLHKSRSSAAPSRFPASECGWHGMPPMTPSTQPRHSRPRKVVASLHTGAGARRPLRIASTRWATAKASLSTMQTLRAPSHASSRPRSRPPPPVQSEMTSRDPPSGHRATFMPPPRTDRPAWRRRGRACAARSRPGSRLGARGPTRTSRRASAARPGR